MLMRDVDERRAFRATIAYLDGDAIALGAVFAAVEADPEPASHRAFQYATIAVAATVVIGGARGDVELAGAALRAGLARRVDEAIRLGEDVADDLGDTE